MMIPKICHFPGPSDHWLQPGRRRHPPLRLQREPEYRGQIQDLLQSGGRGEEEGVEGGEAYTVDFDAEPGPRFNGVHVEKSALVHSFVVV